MATSGAKFKIGTSPSSDRGYDGAASQTLSFQLEASPALDVRSCTYELLLLTKNGPALTLSSGGVATPPTAAVTCALPSGADVYAFAVRCQTNGGEAIILQDGTKDYSVNTFERIVVVRSTLTGLRKIIVGETLEYDPAFGWTEAINEMIDVIETLSAGSITFGGTPPAIAASGSAGVAGSASRSDHTHAHDGATAATPNKLALRDGSGATGLNGIAVAATAAWTQTHLPNASGDGLPDTWTGQAAATGAYNGGAMCHVGGARGDTEHWDGDHKFSVGPEDDSDARSAYISVHNDRAFGDTPFFRLSSNSTAAKIEAPNGISINTSGQMLLNAGTHNVVLGTKPTITGSKGGNVALGNLLAALAAMGLLSDSTT